MKFDVKVTSLFIEDWGMGFNVLGLYSGSISNLS